MITRLLFFLMFLVSSITHASSLRSIPNFFYEYPSSSIEDLVLGRGCLSLHPSKLGLACNPAYLAESKNHQLRFNAMFDSNLHKALAYNDEVKDRDYVGVVRRLVEQRSPVVTRDSASAWYQRNNWAVIATPLRVGFATSVENPAYPEVATQIYRESELAGKMGFNIAENPNLKFGLQARFVQRQYIYQDFDVTSALADPTIVQFHKENIFFLEPGMTYRWDNSWDPMVSATLTNMRVAGSGARSNTTPIFDIGTSSRPAFLNNRLQTTLHFTSRADIPDFGRRFRLGGIYQFDGANEIALSSSIAAGEYALGISGHIDSVVLGFAYKYENLSLSDWNKATVSSGIVQLGLVF